MNTIIPISKARKDIFRITDAVRDGAYVTLTERGEAKAVVMSAEEFGAWQETLRVVEDFPDIERGLAQARRAVASGAYKRYHRIYSNVRHLPRASRQKRTR